MTRAIYLLNEHPPDPALIKGLRSAKCEIVETRTIAETLAQIKAAEGARVPIVLIGELEAGAIPLLVMLRDGADPSASTRYAAPGSRSRPSPPALASTQLAAKSLPPVMIFDREGRDVNTVIRAFQYGVYDYVLGAAPEADRELAARLLVERCQPPDDAADPPGDLAMSPPAVRETGGEPYPGAIAYSPTPIGPASIADASALSAPPSFPFQWDAARSTIRCTNATIYISPTESRIFDLLMRHRGSTVSTEELIQHALQEPGDCFDASVERIRTHVMKLRRKLDAHPAMANRIINVRGTGYMFL